MGILKDKKGITLIELFVALGISTLLLSVVFLGVFTLGKVNTDTYNYQNYQLYGDTIKTFIHNQLVDAQEVKIYSDVLSVDTQYKNILYSEQNQLYLNDINLYEDALVGITLVTEVNAVGSLCVTVVLSDNKGVEKYSTTEEIGIMALNLSSENVDGISENLKNSVIAYNASNSGMGKPEVPDETQLILWANKLRRDMYNVAVLWPTLTKEEKLEFSGGNWASNDNFREGLLRTEYKPAWSTWPKDTNGKYKYIHSTKDTLYISPYIYFPNEVDNTGSYANIFVFVNNTLQRNWNTDLIFDHDEQQWYQKKQGKWSCNKTWDVVKAEIHTSDWEVVKFKGGVVNE